MFRPAICGKPDVGGFPPGNMAPPITKQYAEALIWFTGKRMSFRLVSAISSQSKSARELACRLSCQVPATDRTPATLQKTHIPLKRSSVFERNWPGSSRACPLHTATAFIRTLSHMRVLFYETCLRTEGFSCFAKYSERLFRNSKT